MKTLTYIIALILPLALFAQNPIVSPGVYIADPSARVWKDGRIYIYGSRDESPEYYCSRSYHVLSSDDMLNWTLHENSFASAGPNDEVPYSDVPLYAPDCQYHDGKYYLYYCQPIAVQTGGVAISDSPTGPFRGGTSIDLGDKAQIDPNVFIDDDGQAYYIWGQFSLKIAKLKPNMMEIDHSTLIDGLITEEEHFFHEGANMRKRNGIYYLVYSHMGRGNRPTCIGYATSNSPLGPFKYGGVIIDNRNSDPASWNNHGSIEQYNGQWYVFYHRSTHGSSSMRKACVEPITFNEDGSISEVEMTSQGAGPALNAFEWIDAARACLLHGNVRIQAYSHDAEELALMRNDDKAAYKYLNLANGATGVQVRVAPGSDGGRIDFALGQPWGPSIGHVDVPAGNVDGEWLTLSGTINPDLAKGEIALWLRFWGNGDDFYRIDSFRFMK